MTTTLTVIRAEAGYNVIQVILNPASGRGITRILTPATPSRAWRSGGYNPSFVADNPVWKNVEQKTLEVSEADAASLADAPRAITDRAAKLFSRWGLKSAALALVQDDD